MAESRQIIDQAELNAVIYQAFKIIHEDRKVYPDAYGRRVPGIPQPLTVLVYRDRKAISDIIPSNSEFANYIISESNFYKNSKTKDFQDNAKALKVYNAMGFTYPPSIGGKTPAQYFEYLKETDMKTNGTTIKKDVSAIIGQNSTSYKEAFY